MTVKKNTSNSIILYRGMTDLIKFLSCLMIALHHYSQGQFMDVCWHHIGNYDMFL